MTQRGDGGAAAGALERVRDFMNSSHIAYMQRALELARKGQGRTRPNPPVGAVIVRGGRIVGEGFHPRAGEPHAEIFALRAAGDSARGADLYVTLEPCSHTGRTGPCVEAVITAGLRRVFVGVQDPNPLIAGRGIERLKAAGIQVESGVLEADCRWLIAAFAKHVRTGLPLVTLKAAVTLDGRMATSTGDSRWITGPASREHVHRLRDRIDVIMVGIGTVIQDDPLLTTRLPEGGGRNPLRVVVDSFLRIPDHARVLEVEPGAATLVATTKDAPAEKIARLAGRGVRVEVLPRAGTGVDLPALLRFLGDEGMQSVLLEGGRNLNSTALAENLIDRAMIYLAPKLLGGDDGPGIFAGPGPGRLADATSLHDVRVSRFEDDLLVEGNLKPCSPD